MLSNRNVAESSKAINGIPYFPAATFCDILHARATEMPDKRAFVFLDSSGTVADELCFAILDRRARAVAASLVANRLSGERVLLMFPPGLDFVVALFACFYANAVAVPVPVLSGKRIFDRMNSICGDAHPAGVLTLASLRNDAKASELWLGIPANLVWIQIDRLERGSEGVTLPATKPETLAMLQYTSGSTRSPRGVKLTHANLIANNRMILEAFGHDSTTRIVSWLPLFHDMGLVGHVLQPVYFGGLSVLMSPLSFVQRPVRWLQAISSWKATTSGGPTYAFELCNKAINDEQLKKLDLSTWRVAYCGSEKVRADVLERFGKRFASCGLGPHALRPCFGLAESTLLVSITAAGTELKKALPAHPSHSVQPAVSCGHAARDSSVIVADLHTKVALADGAVGEILVRGPHVAQGYWSSPGTEDNPFFRSLSDGSGPYLRTGDLGFLQDGQLFVVGRIKNTIIINGVKHSAEDIEATVGRSEFFAGFAGAAFAIDKDGQEQAILVQEIGRANGGADEVSRMVSNAFASVTRTHGLRLFDFAVVRAGSLPRTSSGKIRRSNARDIYLADGFKRVSAPRLFGGASVVTTSHAWPPKTADLKE
jgi:acyl-CoA synthetase (AMP-forming)/AMP-acid ligase II